MLKNIYDIYNEDCAACAGPASSGCCATPGNTLGMGNPMCDGDTMSEPIGTAKCRKERLKKLRKNRHHIDEEPKLKEGLLDDMDTVLQDYDNVSEFIKWYVSQYSLTVKNSKKAEQLTQALINSTKFEDDKTVSIDVKGYENIIDLMVIKDTSIFGKINTIKIYNSNDKFKLQTLTPDLSTINIEVYNDYGKSYGDLTIMSKGNILSDKILHFGRITCWTLTIWSVNSLKTIKINNDSIILALDISQIDYIEYEIEYNMKTINNLKVSKDYISKLLKYKMVIPWGCDVDII